MQKISTLLCYKVEIFVIFVCSVDRDGSLCAKYSLWDASDLTERAGGLDFRTSKLWYDGEKAVYYAVVGKSSRCQSHPSAASNRAIW